MDIAGHVSRQMLRHYSHIRMEAKGEALEAVWRKRQETISRKAEDAEPVQDSSAVLVAAPAVEGASLQKSLRSSKNQVQKVCRGVSKSLKRIGSSARTRTWNPSVNSLAEAVYLVDFAARLATLSHYKRRPGRPSCTDFVPAILGWSFSQGA